MQDGFLQRKIYVLEQQHEEKQEPFSLSLQKETRA
jgi:hypothetical protein